jgi:hypothetical protein
MVMQILNAKVRTLDESIAANMVGTLDKGGARY